MKTIFVSSTFQDMQAERDALHYFVVPYINRIALAHGDTVSLCDLRWGINTAKMSEKERAEKTVQVCFNRIDECRPYMIILMGDRYGWIPDRELLDTIRRKYPDAFEGREPQSVTDMEIQYGILGRLTEKDRVLVYFRETEGNVPSVCKPEDPVRERRQKMLRERLKAAVPGQIRQYRVRYDSRREPVKEDIHAFAEQVKKDLEEMILKELLPLEGLSGHEREKVFHETFCRIRAERSVRVQWPDAALESLAGREPIYALRGECGSGKTSMMAHFAMELRKEGATVIPIFAGLTEGTQDSCGILRYMTEEMEDIMGYPHFSLWNRNTCFDAGSPDPKRPLYIKDMEPGFEPRRFSPVALRAGYMDYEIKCYAARLEDLILQWHEKREGLICFLLDAPERLKYDMFRGWLWFTVPKASSRLQMICFCGPKLYLDGTRMGVYALPKADDKDIRLQIQRDLERRGREVDPKVIKAIIKKNRGNLPLTVSFLLDRLDMMDRDDFSAVNRGWGSHAGKLCAYQIKLIERFPDRLEDQIAVLMELAAKRVGAEEMLTLVSLIVCAGDGLRESDLEGICRQENIRWDTLAFAEFTTFLQEYFIRKSDGRYDIASADLKEMLRSRFASRREKNNRILFSWLKSLPDEDPVRMDSIVRQAILVREWDFLTSYITGREGKLAGVSFYRAVWSLCEASQEDEGRGLLEYLRYLDKKGEAAGLDSFFTELHAIRENNAGYVPKLPEIWDLYCECSRRQMETEDTRENRRQYFNAAGIAVHEYMDLGEKGLSRARELMERLCSYIDAWVCEQESLEEVKMFVMSRMLLGSLLAAEGRTDMAWVQYQTAWETEQELLSYFRKQGGPQAALEEAGSWERLAMIGEKAAILLSGTGNAEDHMTAKALIREAVSYAEKLKNRFISDRNTALYDHIMEVYLQITRVTGT